MSTRTENQKRIFRKEYTTDDGRNETIIATVRHDDECGNGHNTFSITGTIHWGGRCIAGGCIHEDIAKHFPELAPLIKWHLCSTDGPLHYLANAIYLAGDKDHSGHAAGEPCDWEHGVRFGDSPVTHAVPGKFFAFLKENAGMTFEVVGIDHEPGDYNYDTHYTFAGFGNKWHECPFRSKVKADEFAEGMNRCKVEFVTIATEFSQGKARELDAARVVAVWPEATDEELIAPGLKERLEARLPALMAEFREAVESLGMTY